MYDPSSFSKEASFLLFPLFYLLFLLVLATAHLHDNRADSQPSFWAGYPWFATHGATPFFFFAVPLHVVFPQKSQLYDTRLPIIRLFGLVSAASAPPSSSARHQRYFRHRMRRPTIRTRKQEGNTTSGKGRKSQPSFSCRPSIACDSAQKKKVFQDSDTIVCTFAGAEG